MDGSLHCHNLYFYNLKGVRCGRLGLVGCIPSGNHHRHVLDGGGYLCIGIRDHCDRRAKTEGQKEMTITICYIIFMFLTGSLLAYVTVDSIRVKKGKKSYIFKDEDEE